MFVHRKIISVHTLGNTTLNKNSCLVFAFGKSYVLLLVARAIQGIGSSFALTASISLLADKFVDEFERGNALGHAIGGLAMGELCKLIVFIFDLKVYFITS